MITLTTDFGASDHFVAAIKGVILSLAPRAKIIDVTHEIAPYQISDGAFVISQAWEYFPKGTIHLVVVDPGVGSERRPIVAEARGHYFVAPDNGVLTMVNPSKVRVLSNRALMRSEVSRTFHGRDIFAPAAAHLERGVPAAKFGKLLTDFVRLPLEPVQISRDLWRGTILKVDRFGNLITNFHTRDFPRTAKLRIGTRPVRKMATTYSDAALGEVFGIVGSSGYIEISVNQGSAAEEFHCTAGTAVDLKTADNQRK